MEAHRAPTVITDYHASPIRRQAAGGPWHGRARVLGAAVGAAGGAAAGNLQVQVPDAAQAKRRKAGAWGWGCSG